MHLDFSIFPIATTVFVIANVAIFAIGLLSHAQTLIIQHYGFVPDALFHNKIINNMATGNNEPPNSISYPTQTTITGLLLYSLIRLFSSMFIHASIAHLGFNLLALVYLGVYAERSIGISRYILVYFMAGITAALFHGTIASYILGTSHAILIGASGAISGVLGIAAVGNTRAYYWLVFQIIFVVLGSVTSIPIAFAAHIGGFIAGLALTMLLIKMDRKSRMKYRKPSGDNSYDIWR
jgi:rhomboid protease GluP